MSMTSLYLDLEEEFGKLAVDGAILYAMAQPYDSLLSPIQRYKNVHAHLEAHRHHGEAFFDSHGHRIATLPTLRESLEEVEVELARPDCPNRDLLERMRDRLREVLGVTAAPEEESK